MLPGSGAAGGHHASSLRETQVCFLGNIEYGHVLPEDADDAVFTSLMNIQKERIVDMSSETFEVHGLQALQDLKKAAMLCLCQFNIPDTTINAFLRVRNDRSSTLMARVVDLWNTGVPEFEADMRAELFLASDKACEVRWGDLFTFPFVRPEMTPATISARYNLLYFAAHVLEIPGASVEMFSDANVRAAVGIERFIEIQSKCMLFWLMKIDKIYYETREGFRVHVDENRAILNVQHQDTDDGEANDDASDDDDGISLAAFANLRPEYGTVEYDCFIARFLRVTMEQYGFDMQLFDWAQQRNYLLPTLCLWTQPLPYLVPRGGGVIMNSLVAPHDLDGITVGDVMIFPVRFIESYERGSESTALVLESRAQFSRRFHAMLMLARAFREPFVLDLDTEGGCSSAAASRQMITEERFSIANLVSNEPLYSKCKELLFRVIARDIEKAPETDYEENEDSDMEAGSRMLP